MSRTCSEETSLTQSIYSPATGHETLSGSGHELAVYLDKDAPGGPSVKKLIARCHAGANASSVRTVDVVTGAMKARMPR